MQSPRTALPYNTCRNDTAIALLVVYCLKGVPIMTHSHGSPKHVEGILVAVMQILYTKS